MRAQHYIGALIVLILFLWATSRIVGHFTEGRGGDGGPDANAIYQQGCDAYRAHDPAQGFLLAQQAIAKDPNKPDFYNLAALCCYERGQVSTGEQFLQKAISLNPNEAKYWEHLGRGLFEEQKVQEAHNALEKGLSCHPSADRAAEINQILQQVDAALSGAAGAGAAGS